MFIEWWMLPTVVLGLMFGLVLAGYLWGTVQMIFADTSEIEE